MAFEILAKLGLNATGFQSGLKRAESQAGTWGKRLRGSVTAQLSAAFGGAAIASGVKRSLDKASEISDQSAAIGVTAERFQELAFAAKMSGADMGDVSAAIREISKSQKEALTGGDNNKALQAFQQMGISVEDLKSKNAPALFNAIAESLEGGATNTAIATNAMELFGKSAGKVLPMMYNGLGEATARAQELGIVLTDEVVASLDESADRVDEFTAQFEAGFSQVTNYVIGFVTKSVDVFEAFFTGIFNAWEKLKDLFAKGLQGQSFAEAIGSIFEEAKKGFTEGFEAAAQDQSERDAKKEQARKKRREALATAQATPFEPTEKTPELAKTMQPASVNQLQRIGAQVSGTPKTETLLKEQLMIQKKIERNTANKAGEVIPA